MSIMKPEPKGLAICPYCEEQIQKIELDYLLYKDYESADGMLKKLGLVKKLSVAYLCSKCHKIISVGGTFG